MCVCVCVCVCLDMKNSIYSKLGVCLCINNMPRR